MSGKFVLRYLLLCGLLAGTGTLSGCQCYRVTHWYAGLIDNVSDYKMELDPLYVPGLDISRVGMPDWRKFGINHLLCPCENGRCCKNCQPIYYPAEYRLKYWEQQTNSASQPEETMNLLPVPELAPLPLPSENLP